MKIPAALQPFLKAIAPAVLTLIAVGVQWAINGVFDRATLAIAITGLCASIVTYFVPNAQPLVTVSKTPVVASTPPTPPTPPAAKR